VVNIEGFRVAKLAELCRRITVGHVGPMRDEYLDHGIPFLRSQNITPFHLNFSELKFVSPQFHAKLRKSALKPRDVVVVRTGYPGTACVIPDSLPESNCADLVVVTPSEQLNPYYLAALFNSAWGMATVGGRLVGVAQQHFNISVAKEMEVRLPPREVQDRIADILCALQDLITNNRQRIHLLDQMARSIYREWFDCLRFPGHGGMRLVDSAIGPVPEGWEVMPLASVAAVNRAQISPGNAPPELHYIDISSVSPGHIDSMTTYAFADAPGRARRIVAHGDVIWSCVRPNRRSHALVMNPNADTIASTGFAVITAEAVPYTFLYVATTTDEFVTYLTNHATGAAYPAVTAATFEQAKLVVPPASLLKKFGELTIPMAEHMDVLHRQVANLGASRDLLLPRLMSGQLTLPEAEEAIPAAL
jgi:type I restriction enzyme, S subunit